ncbi:MAG: glycerol-3-phosphate O-acyltransferase / dihydroxyacetone phosphate acyltransferase [Blastocatellia bacterium]|jgi:1-acyl-sn-glycerol-3-phosphate acyltransferase|nr:glycerol-3-phosphate O-acyltransferase / dihydroxyacetone phosphate acyltransferase [Blastocatellia bacterium]
MIRRIIRALLRIALRVYFRRIEVTGLENVPRDSPVIFVLNHPNALVDPVFLLCLAPRRVAFIAKAPLFRMPVIGYLVRAMDSLPAYRRQDEGQNVARNLETFATASALLARGVTIGICPEGVSHNEPRLKPLKTGAARIALAAASSGQAIDLKIVPVGLYYTEKTTFRSSALLYFAEGLPVKRVTLEPDGTPPREAVRELSDQIETALREVMLHAEQEEALSLIARAEQIFSAAEVDEHDEEQDLARSLELRQRFLEGYAFYRSHSPGRLDGIEARIARFEFELKEAGIDPSDLSLPPTAAHTIFRLLAQVVTCVLLAPLALFGVAVHYPAYRLAGYLSRRLARHEQDVLSTFKIISAMLLFPLTWIIVAVISWRVAGWMSGVAVMILTPLCGYVAVRFFEEIDRFFGSFVALALFVTRRRSFVRLLAERAAIHREILALGSEAEPLIEAV